MQDIKMVDLHKQYLNIKQEVDTAIQEVIDSTAFINGPQVKEFRINLASYLGAKHVISCANGTDALQIALMALGLQPGDEVISPDFTFIATVEVIALMGLKPVIVDIDPIHFTMNTDEVRKAITPRTKVIIPVHLYGQCANMGELRAIASEHNLAIVEDTAQALGADYNDGTLQGKAGTLGTIGCTSFFPSKNLGCFGDGGALMTNNDALAEKIQCMANHGAKVKYYHDEVGINSRLDTIQAAILNVKLKHLDDYTQSRQHSAAYYTKRLGSIDGIITPQIMDYSTHVFHQYTLRVTKGRNDLQAYLKEKGVPTMIYYPVPMHGQKAFNIHGNFPVSEQLSHEVLSLPIHTEQKDEELDYICIQIENYFNR